MNIQDYMEQCKISVENALDKKLPAENIPPSHLHKAMRYSVLNGGKRLRAAFIHSTGTTLGAPNEILTDLGAAIEMIHAFSLIHDDLPALDNDDLRRGKPTCHLAFGEATAILAGDTLHSLAFELISQLNIKPKKLIEMTRLLANAIGSRGMIGGEQLDIEMVGKKVSCHELENMYQLKTGCLFSASIMLATLASNCNDESTLLNLMKFGEYIGISFQIHDDIIGMESDTAILGKKQNADIALDKPIYPLVAGMAQAKKKRDDFFELALSHLEQANLLKTSLKQLAEYVIERDH